MNIYDVIHLVKNQDNVDKIADILDGWEFNTSVMSDLAKGQIRQSAIKIAQMGETKVYNHIKTTYGIRI